MHRNLTFAAPPTARLVSIASALRDVATVRDAVRAATALLHSRGIPEPNASAEHLATGAFAAATTRLHARLSDSAPETGELVRYARLLARRSRRTPVQYLLGEWDFHHITLAVRPPVLIPRPETEGLVDLVLAALDSSCHRRDAPRMVLDVGCGSGAVLLAVLAARPDCIGVGVDVAEHAVALTRENALRLGLNERVTVVHGTTHDVQGIFDVMVSNPPYIRDDEMQGLPDEVGLYEDEQALRGGSDGLQIVREILDDAPRLVKPGGAVAMEVGETHPSALEREEFSNLEFKEGLDDVYGRPRFVQWRVQ